MREADARARMASQVPREERLAKADLVIDNSGTPPTSPPRSTSCGPGCSPSGPDLVRRSRGLAEPGRERRAAAPRSTPSRSSR